MKIKLAALLGLLSVALGAFGAHGLKGQVPEANLEWWKTATQYLLPHAVLMLGIAQTEERWPKITFWLFFVGSLIFAGTLYAMTITSIRVLGAITPIGGALLIAGWGSFFVGSRGAGRGSRVSDQEPR